jgi:DNA-binding transcriptional regulator YbjK
MPPVTATRAEASERVRDAIVAAAVRIVAEDGVAAVTHRRLAADAGVSLSSTTWHFATKLDILLGALRWTADREIERIEAIAARLEGTRFDVGPWATELCDWVLVQVARDRALTVALYRLQIELLGHADAAAVHRDWGEELRELSERVAGAGEAETRVVLAALDGLRLAVLSAGTDEPAWLRPAVHRLLATLTR